MNPRIVLAIARKDIVDVLKNRTTLMALASPLVMAVFFVFLANLLTENTDVTRTLRYYDPSNSGLVAAVDNNLSQKFNATAAASATEVRDAVTAKQSIFGLIVPDGYVAAVKAGQQPQVQVYFDANKSDAQSAGLIVQAIHAEALKLAGIKLPTQVQVEALNVKPASGGVLQDLNINNYYAILALITTVISCGLYIMPNLLVEEKEKKTLRSLIVSPATFGEIVTAKLLVGLLYTGLVSLVVGLINLPPLNTIGLLVVAVILAGVFFNLIGLFIGSISEQMTTANAIIGVVFFLAFFPMLLVLFPFVDTSQGALGVILHIIPSFYFADVFRMASLKAPDLAQLSLSIAICAALIAVVAGLSTWSLRRQRV